MTAASSVKIRSMDIPIIDRVFGMEGGFVLDFSNRTFAEFFHDELDVDIDNPHWAAQGGSKAAPSLLPAPGRPPNSARHAECIVGIPQGEQCYRRLSGTR